MTPMFSRLVCIDGIQKSKTANSFGILRQEKARRPLATPSQWDSCCESEILAESDSDLISWDKEQPIQRDSHTEVGTSGA